MPIPPPIKVENWPRSKRCRCDAVSGELCWPCRRELAEDFATHNENPPGWFDGGQVPKDLRSYFGKRREEILGFYSIDDEEQLRRRRAAIIGRKLRPGESVPVLLTHRDRELIKKHTFADPEYYRRLRPLKDGGVRGKYTLDDLDDLMGFVAAEANHCKSKTLEKELDDLWGRLQAVMDAYDDGEDQ